MKVLHLLVSGKTGGVERLCVDIAKLSEDENTFYFLYGGGKCADEIKEYSNTVVRYCSKLNIIKEILFFKTFIKSHNFNIVILHFQAPLLMFFATMIPKTVPVVMYLHADPNELFKSNKTKFFYNLVEKRLKGFISISQFVASNFSTDKTNKVIYNGTDFGKFSEKKIFRKENIINLIYVGRLEKEKGLQHLLNTLHEIEYPFYFTIVGDGSYRAQLEAEVLSLNMQSCVKFCGECIDVKNYLKKCDLFIHPATINEGFGISLIEAMSFYLPCLAYKRGAIPEIINDNVNGFLVNGFSSDSFKLRLNDVLKLYYKDFEQYVLICNNAKERSKCFTSEIFVSSLGEYLHDLCEE